MPKQPLWLWFAFLISIIPSRLCLAQQLVFDQGFNPVSNSTLVADFAPGMSNDYFAQTFQVGLSGTLGQVNVPVRRFPGDPAGGNMIFEIRRQTGTGAPSDLAGDSLFQLAIPSATIGTSLAMLQVDVSSANMHVTSGDRLAIVMHPDAGIPPNLQYQWLGQDTNPYPNGREYTKVVGNFAWLADNSLYDLGFETYVFVPVPEPVSILGPMFGLLSAIGLLRRKLRLAG